jgi:hypothetical protein
VLADPPAAAHALGRTTTVADDVLTRTIGPLSLNAALALGLGLYLAVRLALPLGLGASVAVLIGCNVPELDARVGDRAQLGWGHGASGSRRRDTGRAPLSECDVQMLLDRSRCSPD